jgi:hypothetical protein
MSPPVAEDFHFYIGSYFWVRGGRHALALAEVARGTAKSWPDQAPQPFILILRGPPDDVLPENFYEFDLADGKSFAFHMMPIHTPAPGRQDYQAVFS